MIYNTLPQTIDEVTQTIMGSTRSLVESAYGAVVNDEASLSIATDLRSEIKRRLKDADGQRTELVKPLNDHVKTINAKFKTVTQPLEDAENALRPKVTAYQIKVEQEKRDEAERIRKAREEELKAAAEAEAKIGNKDGAERLEAMAESVKAKPEEVGRGGFTGAKSYLVSRWVFEVTDIAALALAGAEYVQPNTVAINSAIKAGAREIPGLVIREEKTAAVRG